MNRIKLGNFAGEQVFMAIEGEAAQDIMESAQHIPQHSNGARAEAKLPPVCVSCDYLDKCSYRTPEFCEHPSGRQLRHC